MLDDLNLFKEKKYLEENNKDNLKELRRVSSFLKNFVKINEKMSIVYDNFEVANQNEKKRDLNSQNSVLFSNINNIYESFNIMIKNSQNLFKSMESVLVKPLDDFIDNQTNFYNINANGMKGINSDYQSMKLVLDNSKNNYYKSSYIFNKFGPNEITNSIIRGQSDFYSKRDNLIKNKMIVRNDEIIYKCETEKYNKNILGLNKKYDLLIDNILKLEKTKVHFVQSLLDKFKKYLIDYVKIINEYISQIDKFNHKKTEEQEISEISKLLGKFKSEINNKDNLRIPKEEFISFQNYCEKINDKEIIYKNLSSIKREILNPSLEMNQNQCNNFIKEFVDNLLGENDIGQDKLAQMFELLNLDIYDTGKKILNHLYEKRGKSSIVFLNLKNLEHLANTFGYITLHQNSIFNPQYALNFKIIFISERIFYRKKITNDKVYLNALLSKNKYYRTKQFWRDILELKLVNKLEDHIKRIKNIKNEENSTGSIFSKIFSSTKQSFLEKTRIFPLLKEFSILDFNQIELIEKMAIQEMQSIIKDNIPSFANFNFPSEQSLDLIAELTVEYKIDKEYINFYVTYFNVSSYTIRKLIPNEKDNEINIYKQFKTLKGINKKLKLFKNIIPFLTFSDYNNLLLCSKLFHKKLSKTIYKYILKQKNLSMKIRLSIWQNILGISALKKKYNYKEVLSNAKDENVKSEIELDLIRTTVSEVGNPKEIRSQITNVLYAVSQLNGKIKYCQGMNFVVQLLYEIFGEEEAFYIFLSFFENTEYHLIFDKNLHELKVLFYVFKQVISLLEPELSGYFISNGVDMNFFVSPWFITLFTGSHQYFKDEKDNSQILIRILDNFILSGLKSIMEVGCVALHSYENVLMSKRHDEMMQFIINDMLKSDFFSKNNIDFIENFFTETKISKKLVKNIEEEFNQEEKFKQKANKK